MAGWRSTRIIGDVVLLVCMLAWTQTGFGQTEPSQPATGIEIPADLAEGLTIGLVHVHLNESTGDADSDEALRQAAADVLGIQPGVIFRRLAQSLALQRVEALPEVQSADLRFFRTVPEGQVALALMINPEQDAAAILDHGSGLQESGRNIGFPVIFENDRSKFVFIANGGVGIFSDSDAWFGGYGSSFNNNSPIADDPAGSGTTTWLEAYLEPGIGGISRIVDSPFYAYAAVTYLLSGSQGQDIYNSGRRGFGDFEKLYAGLIWDLPEKDQMIDVSLGRQVYQLRDGFLLSKIPVSTSVGERAALYLGPRLTSHHTALLRVKDGNLAVDAFRIEPSEPDVISTNTRLDGLNLSYRFGEAEAAFTYMRIPKSDSVYRAPNGIRRPRAGLRTYNPSISLKNIKGLNGTWMKAEFAYQDHEEFDMSAKAGYVWAGYEALEVSWRPALSYRWSKFSGDDPKTLQFERFDPLFSGGLGNFLPGIVFSKAYKNSNLITNRATLSVKPRSGLELVLDYFHHRADGLNNLGGIGPLQTLQSRDVGQELTLTAYQYIGTHAFLQGIASVGLPGKAIERALPDDADPWVTLQLALYVFF